MAAPTLAAEGTGVVNTSGNLVITQPASVAADDILIVVSSIWAPNSTGLTTDVADPSGYTQLLQSEFASNDGKVMAWWKRAAGGEGSVTLTRPGTPGWDTGTDTCWGGRIYRIGGCITSGDPWDDIDFSTIYTTSDPTFPVLTVSGSERLGIWFATQTDNWATNPSATDWTTGTIFESGTGTDHGEQTFRQDNISSNTPGTTPDLNVDTANQGGLLLGITFKPPVATASLVYPPMTNNQHFIRSR